MTESLKTKLANILKWCDDYVDLAVDDGDLDPVAIAGMLDDPEVQDFMRENPYTEIAPSEVH